MIDFVGKRRFFYLLTLAIILPGIISILLPDGLRRGIEFSSGTNFSAQFQDEVTISEMRSAMVDLGHPESRIQRTTDGRLLVRTSLIEGSTQAPPFGPAPPSEREDIETALVDRFGAMLDGEGNVTNRFIEFSSVSPSVSADITRHAAIAVAAASVAILGFVTFAFFSVPNPVRYGAAALVALGHDVLIVLGIVSLLGRVVTIEIDTLFLTAMLTIVGFSVHDTIVTFDRMRENQRRANAAGYYPPMGEIVNAGLNQTLARSLNTSITVILVLVALILLGGETIRNFLIVLLIGMVAGTYSSMFIACQLLVTWDKGESEEPPPVRERRPQEGVV